MCNKVSVIGTVFHRLTVIRQDGKYPNGHKAYICVCECGKETRTQLHHLRSGAVRSCGCYRRDLNLGQPSCRRAKLEGKKVGRLTVIRFLEGGKTKNGTMRWECLCECGKTTYVTSSNLTRGSTNSCGCLASEKTRSLNVLRRLRDPWEVERNSYSSGSSYRGIPFNLSTVEYQGLCTEACHYCGASPNTPPHSIVLRERGVLKNGIDRVDSAIGYERDNCVPCCPTCNKAKGVLSYSEFLNSTRRRYEHMLSLFREPDLDNAPTALTLAPGKASSKLCRNLPLL